MLLLRPALVTAMRRWALPAAALCLGCSARDTSPVEAAPAESADAGVDLPSLDSGFVRRPKPPVTWDDAEFIDVHTHCGLSSADCDGERCCDFSGWTSLQATHQGRAVLLSNEYWRINEALFPAEFQDYFKNLNDAYLETASVEDTAIGFVGLRCLYTETLDVAWADKCKAEAKLWIERGAFGFKDHIGKQFESGGVEYGYFLGGWNRYNGFCSVSSGSSSPNSDCMQQPTVRYLALEPAWREVVRYIIQELKVPIVSHAASFDGADTECFDPDAGSVGACAAVTREHQLRFAEWVGGNVDPASRRRLIIAHMGFLTKNAEGLRRMLDAGVSTDTARFESFAAAGCAGRALFAAYPQQLLFGTDRRVDQGCLPASYDAFLHALRGDADEPRSFDSCWGPTSVVGMQLQEPSVPGCPDVPVGALDNVLKLNFLRLYE